MNNKPEKTYDAIHRAFWLVLGQFGLTDAEEAMLKKILQRAKLHLPVASRLKENWVNQQLDEAVRKDAILSGLTLALGKLKLTKEERKLVHRLRKYSREKPSEAVEEEPLDESWTDVIAYKHVVKAVGAALHCLPLNQREKVMLFYMQRRIRKECEGPADYLKSMSRGFTQLDISTGLVAAGRFALTSDERDLLTSLPWRTFTPDEEEEQDPAACEDADCSLQDYVHVAQAVRTAYLLIDLTSQEKRDLGKLLGRMRKRCGGPPADDVQPDELGPVKQLERGLGAGRRYGLSQKEEQLFASLCTRPLRALSYYGNVAKDQGPAASKVTLKTKKKKRAKNVKLDRDQGVLRTRGCGVRLDKPRPCDGCGEKKKVWMYDSKQQGTVLLCETCKSGSNRSSDALDYAIRAGKFDGNSRNKR